MKCNTANEQTFIYHFCTEKAMETPESMIKVCEYCKDAKHDQCDQRLIVGVRCDCKICRDEFLKQLRISEIEITKGGRCLKIKIGNWTNFIDVRDLYISPNWNDREDNKLETLGQIKKDRESDN